MGGRAPAADSAHAHAVGAGGRELDAGEIGDAIGRDVVFRIAQFVQKLLLDGVDAHASAGRFVFGDDESAIGLGFDDRIADVRHIGNALPIHLAIAAGALRAAFDDMSGDCARCKLVVLIGFPSEAMDHGRERERGIGRAARDDDVRSRRQRLRQRESADVGVGALDAIANFGQRLAGIHIAHFVALGQELVEAGEDVVAEHDGDFQTGRKANHFARAGYGIHAAGIGDDCDAALADARARCARPAAENRAHNRGWGRPASASAESTW